MKTNESPDLLPLQLRPNGLCWATLPTQSAKITGHEVDKNVRQTGDIISVPSFVLSEMFVLHVSPRRDWIIGIANEMEISFIRIKWAY